MFTLRSSLIALSKVGSPIVSDSIFLLTYWLSLLTDIMLYERRERICVFYYYILKTQHSAWHIGVLK